MASYEHRTTREIAIDRINDAARVLQDVKDRNELNFEMYAGNQWPDDLKKQYEDLDKAAIVFNQILSVINSAAGTEQINKFIPKYRPRTIGEMARFADMLNGCLRYMRDSVDADDEESSAFMDTLVGGIGAVRFHQDYTETPEGRTRSDRVSIFKLWWDHNAEKINLKDGRWIAEYDYVPKEEAQQEYPEYAEEIDAYCEAYIDIDAQAQTQVSARIAGDRWYQKDRDEVLIYTYYYRKLDPYFLAVDPETKEAVEYNVEEWKNLKTNLRALNEEAAGQGGEQMPLPTAVRLSKYTYYRMRMMGPITLEDGLATTQSGFPIKFITCFRWQQPEIVEWFGLVDVMRDPQIWANRMLSQLAHIIATNPKGAILAEEGTFDDEDKAMDDWGKANAVIRVREGALVEGALKVVQGAYPENQERLYQLASEAVTKVLGFSPIQVGGQADLRRVSGQVTKFVEQSSEAMLSFPFSALKSYRKAAGRQYLEHMKVFMPEGVMVRVSSPGMADYVVQFKRDWVDLVEYDVVIDQVATSATQRRELWESLNVTQSLDVMMQNGAMTPDIVIELIPDLPEELREKMRENLREQDMVEQMVQALAGGDPNAALQLLAQHAQEQGVDLQASAPPEGGPVQ
jgi:hypothetical protein